MAPVAAPLAGLGAAGAAGGGGVPAVPVDAGSLPWVAAEAAGGFKYGDQVHGVVAATADGAKAVHVTASGVQVFVACIRGHDRELRLPGGWDHRTVERVAEDCGRSEAPLKDVVHLCSEVPVQWGLSGPRTARWCLQYLIVEGLGLEGHHERVRQLCKVDSSAWGIQEHWQLSNVIKHSIQTDQLNCCNLLSLEVMFRRLQTIEYAYSEKAKETESRAVGGRLSLEEQQTFGGTTRLASTLMVCPELLEHVKSEVERDASLAKNLRKAREERELARRNAKKGGKAGDDGQ